MGLRGAAGRPEPAARPAATTGPLIRRTAAAPEGKFLPGPLAGPRVQGETVLRRGPGLVASAIACALVGGVLPALTGDATAAPVPARTTSSGRLSVPALLAPGSLRAQLPAGGTVSYLLPPLPDGGVRVLGDWNGDGVQTPGIFAGGQWQLWNQVQRADGPAVTTTFGQPGDVRSPATGTATASPTSAWCAAPSGSSRSARCRPTGPPRRSGATSPSATARGVPVDRGLERRRHRRHRRSSTTAAGCWPTPWTTSRRPRPRSYGAARRHPGRRRLGRRRQRRHRGRCAAATWYLSNRVVATSHGAAPDVRAGDRRGARWPGRSPTCPVRPPARPPARSRDRRRPAGWCRAPLLGSDVHHGVGRAGRRVRALARDVRALPARRPVPRAVARDADARLPRPARPATKRRARHPAAGDVGPDRGRSGCAPARSTRRRSGRTAPPGLRYVDQLVRSIACAHVVGQPGRLGARLGDGALGDAHRRRRLAGLGPAHARRPGPTSRRWWSPRPTG